MKKLSPTDGMLPKIGWAALLLLILALSHNYNFLLFHTLAELFSILIAGGMFVLTWTTRDYRESGYLTFLGVSFLLVGGVDLLHTLAYKGMPIFPRYDANLPTQLWLLSRFIQSVSLLLAPLYVRRPIRATPLLLFYLSFTGLVLVSIFGGVFPAAYIEGSGLTPFKIASEWVFIAIFVAALGHMWLRRAEFSSGLRNLLSLSILFGILTEVAFMLYVGVFDLSNMLGHYIKIISFYFIYSAIIETGLRQPLDVVFRDAQQRQLELLRLNQQLETILSSIPVAMWIADRNGTILRKNQMADTIWGGDTPMADTVEEYAAYNGFWSDTGAPIQADEWALAVAVQQNRAVYNQFVDIQRFDGKMATIINSGVPIRDENGAVIGAVAISMDVTRQRQLEQQASQRARELAIAQESLRDYAARLEASNHELEQFAFVASHDLQEPLRKIRLFGARLNEKLSENPDEDVKDYLQRMVNSSERMQRLINDLLEYSRLNTRRAPFTTVDLNQVVNDVLGDLEVPIHQSGAQVEVNPLPVVQADRLQMHQMFQNLLSNALKFTQKDVPPVIAIGMDGADGAGTNNNVVMYVRDTGIGFNMQDFERILQPFQRLHGQSEYPGSGIGLAVVRKIVERHRGHITAESRPGEGTTFWITLPEKQS